MESMQEALETEKRELNVLKEIQEEINMLNKDLERAKIKQTRPKKSLKHTAEWQSCMVQLRLQQEDRRVLQEKVAKDVDELAKQLQNASSRKYKDHSRTWKGKGVTHSPTYFLQGHHPNPMYLQGRVSRHTF